MFDRQRKISAIKILLAFSLLITEEEKSAIIDKLESFSDADLMVLGELLSYEHKNRDILDKATSISFLKELNRVISKN